MSKQYSFKTVYLWSEYFVIFIVLNRFFAKDILLYSFSLMFLYFAIGLLYEYKVSKRIILFLFPVPLLIVTISPLRDVIRLLVIFILTALSFFRVRSFYDGGKDFEYGIFAYGVECVAIIVLCGILTKSMLILYILLLKLNILIGCNTATSNKLRANIMDILLLSGNLVLAVFLLLKKSIVLAMNAGVEYLNAAVVFASRGLGWFVGILLNYKKLELLLRRLFENLFSAVGKYFMMFTRINEEQSKRYSQYTAMIVQKVILVILIIVAVYLAYVLIKKLYQFIKDLPEIARTLVKKYEERKNAIIIKNQGGFVDKVEYYKPEPHKRVERISEIRQLYRNVIEYAIKNGYFFKNSSTSRNVTAYLKKIVTDKQTVEKIGELYEKERYSPEKYNVRKEFRKLYDEFMRDVRQK